MKKWSIHIKITDYRNYFVSTMGLWGMDNNFCNKIYKLAIFF